MEAFYPVVFLDAIRIKVRESHRVSNRAAHIAVGVDMDGIKHVLGIWVQAEEGASLTGGACAPSSGPRHQRHDDRRGGHLPLESAARGGMRRAHGPFGGDLGDLARLHSPDLRG